MTSPGPGQPLDVAFVEIVPDTDLFVTRLRQQTRAAFDDLARTAERAGESVEKDLTEAADDAGKAFERSGDQIGEAMQDAATSVEKSFDKVDDASRGLHRDLDRRIRHTADVFDEHGKRIGETLKDALDQGTQSSNRLKSALGTLGESLVSIGSALVGLGAAAPTPAGIIAITVALAAAAAITPLILSLTAALADLAGFLTVLPAGAAVLAAAIAPLVVAFQGFGKAIEAIIEGDPDKIAEALDRLAPAAQRVAKEFQALLPQFTRFREIVQEDFFRPLEGSLTAVTNNLLPALMGGMSRVATALGELGAQFARALSSAATQQTLTAVFDSAEVVIRTIGPSLIRLFEAVTTAVRAGLPFVERISIAISDVIEKFASFLSTSIESGQFNAFFEDAFVTFGELKDLGAAVGELLVAVFGDLDDVGRSFIGTLTDLVNRMTDFFESAEGQDLINDLIERVPEVARVLGFLVNVIIEFLDIVADINDATEAVIGFFKDLGTTVGDVAGDIGDFIANVGAFFASLPDRILGAVAALPGLISDFFNFLFDQVFEAIGRGIGLLIFTFTELPGLLLAAIVALPGILSNFFQETFTNLTALIIGALNNLIKIIPELLGQAVEFGRQAVVNGFNRIVEFIRGLPARIRDAFLAAGSLVVEIGAAIGNALKNTINRAIDRINEGIRQVDDVLPGTLPRIPKLEHGGVATEPTLAAIAEHGRSEGVIPLENPRALRMIGDAIAAAGGGSGAAPLFGPGSIVVNFAGTIPTPAQAQRVGRDIGTGVAQALEQRDARLRVRTL